jgi:hypothetical protein
VVKVDCSVERKSALLSEVLFKSFSSIRNFLVGCRHRKYVRTGTKSGRDQVNLIKALPGSLSAGAFQGELKCASVEKHSTIKNFNFGLDVCANNVCPIRQFATSQTV